MVDEPKSKSTGGGGLQALSVVLPAFNEEANIEQVVRACVAYLDAHVPDYELLVVKSF